MNTKRILIGAVLAAVVYFLLGWLMYGNLMQDYFMRHHGSAGNLVNEVMRDNNHMLLWAIGLGNLASGMLLAIIYERSAILTFTAGMVMGGIIGLFSSLAHGLIMYGASNMMDKFGVMGDVMVMTIMSALAGGVCGMVMGKVSPKMVTTV